MRERLIALLIAAAALVLLMPWCLPADPSAQLVQTTHEAVKLADRAVSQDRSAVLWSGRFRLLAIVAGTSIPLLIAYLIWRSSDRNPIDPAEVIDCLHSHEMIALPNPAAAEFPSETSAPASEPISPN